MKRLFHFIAIAIFCFSLMIQQAQAADLLIPGGQVIGLELHDDTVTVAAFDDQLGSHAKNSGLRIGDKIVSINGISVKSIPDIRNILENCGGEVRMTVLRGSGKHVIKLQPHQTVDGPKLGIYLRQGIAGIGTVTYYDPETMEFGALGHGVSDSGGELLHLREGSAYFTGIQSVKKGQCGQPGQLRGNAQALLPIASLRRNTSCGVFGIMNRPFHGKPLPVADFEDVRPGSATILSTVSGDSVQEYSVEILKIYPQDRADHRNFLLKVTDPALLAATGGIVQGMSGSPICQDGRIVGAVTHVLVNDPTMGYGIFIENMLDAAA